MCFDRRKNHGCGQKKPEGTSSAIFGVGTAAKCCELKRCADLVRKSSSECRNLNFSASTKKTTEYSFELFISIYRYLIFCLKFKTSHCQTIVLLHWLFPPRKDGILHPLVWLPWDYPHPPPESVRTDGRTLTSEPNFLASIGYQICLAMVPRVKNNEWVIRAAFRRFSMVWTNAHSLVRFLRLSLSGKRDCS